MDATDSPPQWDPPDDDTRLPLLTPAEARVVVQLLRALAATDHRRAREAADLATTLAQRLPSGR